MYATSEAGYTCAVEPTVIKQSACIEEESIYGRSRYVAFEPLADVNLTALRTSE